MLMYRLTHFFIFYFIFHAISVFMNLKNSWEFFKCRETLTQRHKNQPTIYYRKFFLFGTCIMKSESENKLLAQIHTLVDDLKAYFELSPVSNFGLVLVFDRFTLFSARLLIAIRQKMWLWIWSSWRWVQVF